jgi:hypothetical protein
MATELLRLEANLLKKLAADDADPEEEDLDRLHRLEEESVRDANGLVPSASATTALIERSEDPWAIACTLIPAKASAEKKVPATPLRRFIPSPTIDTIDIPWMTETPSTSPRGAQARTRREAPVRRRQTPCRARRS